MKVKIFSSRKYEEGKILNANKEVHELTFEPKSLDINTVNDTINIDVVSVFTNDTVSVEVLEVLHQNGVKHISIRAAGYNNVAIEKAKALGISIANVPAYSPYAVAEHTVALILALNRKLIQTEKRVAQHNFTLDGLEGFDLNGKTVGIIGLGKIGLVVAKIMNGFGCNVLAYDIDRDEALAKKSAFTYTDLTTLISSSDIITLHAPLTAETNHMLNTAMFNKMKTGVMIVNSGRGALISTKDALKALESGKIGYLGLDVYENEKGIFFYDHSKEGIQDDMLDKLMKMPNVILTPHMSFLTETALKNIADTTLENINAWSKGEKAKNEL